MRVEDIIQTTKKRSYAYGRSEAYYEASINGDLRQTAAKKGDAQKACLVALKVQIANLRRRKYFFSPSGRTVFAVRYLGGWGYDIMSASRSGPAIVAIGETFDDCCKHAAKHAADFED